MEEKIKLILKESMNAPSGDNSQPWQFKLQKGNELFILKKKEGNNDYLDFESRGTLVAHGALLTNITIAASAYAYRTEISLFPEASNKEVVSKVVFMEDNHVQKDLLYESLGKRSTNRKIFKKKDIPAEQIKLLIQGVEDETLSLAVCISEEQKNAIFSATTQMERIALGNKYLHKLFFDSIVWSDQDEKKRKQGLYIKTMELPKPIELFFRLLKHWIVAQALSKIGFPRKVAQTNASAYQSSSAAIVFTLKADLTPTSFVHLGMAIEKVWLRATHYNIAVQPLAGLLYVYQRLHSSARGFDSVLTKQETEIVDDSYKKIASYASVLNGTIAMILRVGYADEPSATSTKKEPEFL